MPTAIEHEIKNLEKAKERQKIEIQAIIQHNLNKQQKFKEMQDKSPERISKIINNIILKFNL